MYYFNRFNAIARNLTNYNFDFGNPTGCLSAYAEAILCIFADDCEFSLPDYFVSYFINAMNSCISISLFELSNLIIVSAQSNIALSIGNKNTS